MVTGEFPSAPSDPSVHPAEASIRPPRRTSADLLLNRRLLFIFVCPIFFLRGLTLARLDLPPGVRRVTRTSAAMGAPESRVLAGFQFGLVESEGNMNLARV
jgi:hypothetical protein